MGSLDETQGQISGRGQGGIHQAGREPAREIQLIGGGNENLVKTVSGKNLNFKFCRLAKIRVHHTRSFVEFGESHYT